MDDTKTTTGAEETIELKYACHFMEDGRTVCGRHLAGQLIDDAMKLLVPLHGFNVDAAWKEFWELAAPAALPASGSLSTTKRRANFLKQPSPRRSSTRLLSEAPLTPFMTR